MPEDYFGKDVAAHYDGDPEHDPMFSAEAIDPVVDFLVERAEGGAALELGIGTGRIALPLAERGVQVHGIDLSEAMVARLKAKPGGDRIPVVIGDFAAANVEGGVHACIPRLQHDPEPDNPGCAGRVLRERCGAPRAGRLLRDRGRAPRREG